MPATIDKIVPLSANLPTTQSPRWKFKYEDSFECNMECMQCMARMGNRRCTRKSCYTIPYCWQHLKLIAHLRVGRTTLKNPDTGRRFTFRGLFACDAKNPGGIVFRHKDIITPYVGEILNQDELDERYDEDEVAPYVEHINVGMVGDPSIYVDGACIRGVGALANDATGSTCTTGHRKCHTNAEFFSVNNESYPVLRATKNIRDGDEIFVNYGPEYWAGDQRPHTTSPASVYRKLEYKC